MARKLAVVVPITFETYRERLRGDATRPRLRPELDLEEELRIVFQERQDHFSRTPDLWTLAGLLRAAALRPTTRVVTLPPDVTGEAALEFARRVRDAGADLLELRTDLHPPTAIDPDSLSRTIELLVAERGSAIPSAWSACASWTDVSVESHSASVATPCTLLSHHAETYNHLRTFGPTTVLATGLTATPFRALLAQRNAFDYLAPSADASSAPGQRLLADAVRDTRKRPSHLRLGILGHPIAHSLSPALHPWPFDRIDLPRNTDLAPLLDALHPHYAGFAVTSPFKRPAARTVGSPLPAINTLVRTPTGWDAHNTDVEGALAILDALSPSSITILGYGGAATALASACGTRGIEHRILRREALPQEPLRGICVWTWPTWLSAPSDFRFEEAQVALIAYGPPARLLAQTIVTHGGTPRMLGHKWLIAQARRQRALWEPLL